MVILFLGQLADDTRLVQEVAVNLCPLESSARHLHFDKVALHQIFNFKIYYAGHIAGWTGHTIRLRVGLRFGAAQQAEDGESGRWKIRVRHRPSQTTAGEKAPRRRFCPARCIRTRLWFEGSPSPTAVAAQLLGRHAPVEAFVQCCCCWTALKRCPLCCAA